MSSSSLLWVSKAHSLGVGKLVIRLVWGQKIVGSNPTTKTKFRRLSSVDKSTRLLTERSLVQIQESPPYYRGVAK